MDNKPEPWWESLLAGLVGAILCIAGLLLMLSPPKDKVIYHDDNVTIVKRTTK